MNNTDTFINRRLARERIEREGAETISADPTIRHSCPRCQQEHYVHKGTKLAIVITLSELEQRMKDFITATRMDLRDQLTLSQLLVHLRSEERKQHG